MRRYVKPAVKTEIIKEHVANKFVLENFLFDKQLAFVEDKANYKVAVCSRRAGKTVSCAAHLIHTCINNPEVSCWYITLSAKNARRIIWKDLLKINKDYNLGGKPNEVDLTITFQNKSTLYVTGAKDATEIENFRGVAMKLVYIDECQSFREYIKDLIDDIIEPTLIDYAGTLCLIGTPRAVATGYFHECAVKSDAWAKHGWTYWDNPWIEKKSGMTHQQTLDRVLKRRKLTIDHPSIQREFFGKWEPDTDSLLIRYNPAVNSYEELPKQPYSYVMGIDVGFKDADAICILAYSDKDPCTYLVEEVITARQGLTELVEQIQALRKKYEISKIVMDMGGLGLKLGEEMSRRYLIPVEPAIKTRKMENIELMNDALRRGHLKVKTTSQFANDSYLLEIDRDKSTPDKIAVSDNFHSDIIDAVLYAFKLSPAYAYEPEIIKPKIGTKEWAKAQEDQMFNSAVEHFQTESNDETKWNEALYGTKTPFK